MNKNISLSHERESELASEQTSEQSKKMSERYKRMSERSGQYLRPDLKKF